MDIQNSGPDRPTMRAITRAYLLTLKMVIAPTGLFPPEMLDDITSPLLGEAETADRWLTLDDGEPVAVAHFAPERLTSGTWNLYLIVVRADRQGRGYGVLLLDSIERDLAARGERILIVETSGLPAFKRTRTYYERCRHEREARIRNF